jgi:hypothetical protein
MSQEIANFLLTVLGNESRLMTSLCCMRAWLLPPPSFVARQQLSKHVPAQRSVGHTAISVVHVATEE